MSRKWMWILWPGFLVAIPGVGITFSLFDPADIQFFGTPVKIDRMTAYTLGFFFFWIIGVCCSALTYMLQRSPQEVNS